MDLRSRPGLVGREVAEVASRPGWVAVGLSMDDLGFWPVGIDVATSF